MFSDGHPKDTLYPVSSIYTITAFVKDYDVNTGKKIKNRQVLVKKIIKR